MKGSYQKILACILLLLIPCFILCNFAFFKSKRDLSCAFCNDFIKEELAFVEKPFVFLLYSSDELTTCEQNISSILEQKYDNYRIVMIETGNIRSSTPLLKTMVAKEGKGHLLTVLPFTEALPTIECFQKALTSIKDSEIVIQLDCNDWLANDLVLEKLNQTYNLSDETWLTYSQYIEYPSYQKGTIDPYLKKMLRNRHTRKIPWITSYLKTYYAGLFKQIKPDPRFNNKKTLSPETLDLYFLPLAEYSKNHIRFIEDVLYIHNAS
jgi:hypothetical protein